MGTIISLEDIEVYPKTIYVMHERCEKYISFHQHAKCQLTYVEGGLAYLRIGETMYTIPARHYFWIPAGIAHNMKIGHPSTACRTVFFPDGDADDHGFYQKFGIYPVTELVLQMLIFSSRWEGHQQVGSRGYSFLKNLKEILPEVSSCILSVALPFTGDERMLAIMGYMEEDLSLAHSLTSIGTRFGISERSLSRMFRKTLNISFLQYLKLLRMARAFELIKKNRYTLAEIAFLCGYQSLSAFSNTFYQLTKSRPSDHSIGSEALPL